MYIKCLYKFRWTSNYEHEQEHMDIKNYMEFKVFIRKIEIQLWTEQQLKMNEINEWLKKNYKI